MENIMIAFGYVVVSVVSMLTGVGFAVALVVIAIRKFKVRIIIEAWGDNADDTEVKVYDH